MFLNNISNNDRIIFKNKQLTIILLLENSIHHFLRKFSYLSYFFLLLENSEKLINVRGPKKE